MSWSLAPEQEVTVRRVGSDKEARFRVIGLVGLQAEGSAYGMALLDPIIVLTSGTSTFLPRPHPQRASLKSSFSVLAAKLVQWST